MFARVTREKAEDAQPRQGSKGGRDSSIFVRMYVCMYKENFTELLQKYLRTSTSTTTITRFSLYAHTYICMYIYV